MARLKRIVVRTSSTELELLHKAAAACNLTLSDYVRHTLLDSAAIVIDAPESLPRILSSTGKAIVSQSRKPEASEP